jgi:gamma-glutamylcyclotransferase (GGCT)/AIG2-like uncharacterized protein YtfP
MRLYFAYGSNMCRSGMAKRCPGAVALGTARLHGHRFRINVDGYATVVPAPDGVVHGVLWRVSPRDIRALDAYEDIAGDLYRKLCMRVRCGPSMRLALVYVANRQAPGRPRPGYHDTIVMAAARAWRLPESYLRELAGWSAARRASPVGRGVA